MRETSTIEIDLAAVTGNMGRLRRLVGPDCSICAVVKADAYGLGAGRLSRCLAHAGAEMLAVFTPDQAAELAGAAVSGPVLVLMPVESIGRGDELYRSLVCGRLHLTVHGPEHLDRLITLSERHGVRLPVHLDVDTGMSRGGCDAADVPILLERIAASRRLRLAGIATQFAASDSDEERTALQFERFEALLRENEAAIPPDCFVHAANTCATLRSRSFHRSMVRVGQAWAGYGPEIVAGKLLPGADALTPAVRWSSRLVHVKRIEAGTSVGYGAAWTARRRSVIGLVPVGYADGYPTSVAPGARRSGRKAGGVGVAIVVETPDGPVRAHAPVVGRVSMDQITVDLTDLRAGGRRLTALARVGTTVELITPDRDAPNHLTRLADAAGTPPHEILCGLNPRIRRVYRRPAVTTEVFEREPATAAAG